MRSMAGNWEAMDDLRRILSSREALYSKADVIINTSAKTAASAVAYLSKAMAHQSSDLYTESYGVPQTRGLGDSTP